MRCTGSLRITTTVRTRSGSSVVEMPSSSSQMGAQSCERCGDTNRGYSSVFTNRFRNKRAPKPQTGCRVNKDASKMALIHPRLQAALSDPGQQPHGSAKCSWSGFFTRTDAGASGKPSRPPRGRRAAVRAGGNPQKGAFALPERKTRARPTRGA